ncbi:MAG: PAS domain-containing protein [Burkholderiales bacterium]|nr:PAS domain-containing protein [Burkholderiales bacterium]
MSALPTPDYCDCFKLSPAAQAILDRGGEILDINARACLALGYERAALLGRRLVDLVLQEDQDAVLRAIQQSAQDRVPFEVECRVGAPGLGMRWFSVQSSPSFRDDRTVAWYTIFADITDRKKQDAWLSQRNALLTALSHNLPGMIYVFRPGPDKGGRMDFVSEGVRQVFGATPEEALASPWVLYNRVLPEDLGKFFQQRDDAIGASGRLHSEFRLRNGEGELRWCSADSVAGLDSDGNEVRCGYISDITEHKLYLEARMAAETAERASQAKSEFLSRMSHELRTPLNAVIGFAQLLRIDTQPRLSESQLRKAELIERSGAHLLAVISDVLDLSRIEAGDMPISIEPVHVDTTVQDALAMVAEAAQAAKVHLMPPLFDLSVPVMADRVRLRQILMNLISNAIKYNRPDGEVRVRVWQDDTQVSIQVSDTGLGLSVEQQAHLFEPFNRLGAEQTGVEGTGIGLVIVHRLIELMNGTLAVNSQQGVGTTFTVVLPAADTDQPSDHGALIDLPQPTGSATVLYVEDNEVNVILVRQIMALRPAWKLVVANSGEQALKMVRQERPDLLLLDMHLGDMSGFELVDLLDADPATRGIPKVALSADAMPDRVHAARERGFSAYITKPLNVAMLLQCLEEQLSKV